MKKPGRRKRVVKAWALARNNDFDQGICNSDEDAGYCVFPSKAMAKRFLKKSDPDVFMISCELVFALPKKGKKR